MAIARALSWSAAGAVSGVAVQVALLAILSRLLQPSEFGVIALATFALRFVSCFAQLGLGPALIQRQVLEPGHESAALILSAAVGLVCWLALVPSASALAYFFRDPTLREVLLAMPAALALGSIASVPHSLLRKRMRFRAVAVVDLSTVSLGYGLVSVVLAWKGYGAWSLVWASVAQPALGLVLGWVLARPRLALPTSRQFREIAGYGSRYTGIGFLDFLSSNVETLYIARRLDVAQLGIFNRAQAVSTVPVDLVMGSINRVMFPVFSAVRSDRARLARTLALSIELSVLVTFPLAAALSIAASEVVLVALGSPWEHAIQVVTVLAWSIPAAYVSTFVGITLDSLALFRAKTSLIIAVTVAKLALMMIFTISHGLVGVVIAIVLGEWLRAALGMRLLTRELALPGGRLARAVARASVLGLVAGSAAWLPRLLLAEEAGPSMAAVLALQIVLCAGVMLLLGRHLLRRVVTDAERDGADLSTLRRLARV